MTPDPLRGARPGEACDASAPEVSTAQGVLAVILIVVGAVLTVARIIRDLT